MKTVILSTIEEQNLRVAKDIAAYINSNPGTLLCLAAGDTPLGAYHELVKLQDAGKVNLNSVYYVGLDEWVGLGKETRGSCIQVMYDAFFGPAHIESERYTMWNGLCENPNDEIKRMNAYIASHDHINFTLLGVGMNGHIGFNEPGSGLPEGGIHIALDDTTKSVSVKYFDSVLPVQYGLGVGAGTLKKADVVYLMANETRKADIIAKAVSDPLNVEVPASMLMDHPDLTLYLDRDAAAGLVPENQF